MSRKALLAAVAGAVACSAWPSSPAQANNFGSADPNDGLYLADSWSQHFSFHGAWPQDQRTEIALTMSAYSAQTDLQVDSAPDNQVWGANMYRIDDGQNYAFVGITLCRPGSAVYGTPHHTVCQVKNIKYNNANLATPLGIVPHFYDIMTPVQRKYVVTHEYGHSVGLRHSNAPNGTTDSGVLVPNTHPAPAATSMQTGTVSGYLGLHPHDVSHTDVHYL